MRQASSITATSTWALPSPQRETQVLGKTENSAPCLRREAAYVSRLQEAGLVMSLKGSRHAVHSGRWRPGCRCKTKRTGMNITFYCVELWGAFQLQSERPSPAPRLKGKRLTISQPEWNQQALCWDNFSTGVDPFVWWGVCAYSVEDSEVHSMCRGASIAHRAQQGLCLPHHAAQTHTLHSSERRERGHLFRLRRVAGLSCHSSSSVVDEFEHPAIC